MADGVDAVGEEEGKKDNDQGNQEDEEGEEGRQECDSGVPLD